MSNPKIIYDVEFRIDSSKVDTIANSLSKSDKATKSVTKSTSRYSEEIKKVIDQNQVHIQEINKTQTAINAKIKAERNDIATQKEQVKIARKKREQLVKVRGALNDQLKSTKLNNAERARLSGQVARLNNQEKMLIQTEHNYVRALNETIFGLERAENATESYSQSSRALQGQQKSTNKAIASSNQVFFSASDLIQDSAQFSYGWASGMRAVGNNIGYTAELLANLSTRAKEANKSLGSVLKQSIKGVGGAMLALNVAITAGTMLLTKFGKESKEVSDALQELIEKSSQLRDLGSFDFLGTVDLERQIKLLSREEEAITSIVEANNKLKAAIIASNIPFKDRDDILNQEASRVGQYKRQLEKLEKQYNLTSKEAESYSLKLKENKEKLQDLLKQAEKDPLAKLRQSYEGFIDREILKFDTGIINNKQTLQSFAGFLQSQIIDIRNETDAGKGFLHAMGIHPDDTMFAIEVIQRELSKLIDFVPKKPIVDIMPTKDEFLDNTDDIIKSIGLLEDFGVPLTIIPLTDEELQGIDDPISIPIKYQDLDPIESEFNRILKSLEIMNEKSILDIDTEASQENLKRYNSLSKEMSDERIAILKHEADRAVEIERHKSKMRDTLQKTSFSLASQYIGALSQLNQAQADDTEKQARKKFETQKKLQKASALVNAGQAIVRQFSDLDFFAALATSSAIALITKKQIDAINAVDFEGGGSSSMGGSAANSSYSQGFSEASFSNPVAIKAPTYTPQNAQQTDPVINITLQTEADDTVIAMKAENGRKQMITNSVTVTNG